MIISAYGEIVAKGFLITHDEFYVLLKRFIEVTRMEEHSACKSLMKHTLFLDETGYYVTQDIPNVLIYSKMFQVEEDSNVEIIELKDELKRKKKTKKEKRLDNILNVIKELILEDKIKYWISTKDTYPDKIMGKTDISQLTFVLSKKGDII